MLSTVGRAAIRRIGGGASTTTTTRTLQSLWGLQRVDSSKAADASSQQLSWARLARFYATAGSTTAKPKAPRKKSTTTTKTGTSKAKKTTTRATKKAAPKKKKAAVKKKPGRKPTKKVLTPEEKFKADIQALKLKALLKEEPSRGFSTAYSMVVMEVVKGTKGGLKTSEVVERYRSASPAEREEYNQRASEHNEAASKAHKKWVESHSVQAIRDANNARKRLRRELNAKGKYPLIADDRLPKRPATAYFLFIKDRHASGNISNQGTLADKSRLILEEWQSLSSADKQPYLDRAAADLERYRQEFLTVYGKESQPNSKPA